MRSRAEGLLQTAQQLEALDELASTIDSDKIPEVASHRDQVEAIAPLILRQHRAVAELSAELEVCGFLVLALSHLPHSAAFIRRLHASSLLVYKRDSTSTRRLIRRLHASARAFFSACPQARDPGVLRCFGKILWGLVFSM